MQGPTLLRQAIAATEITRAAVAASCGVSAQTVSAWLAGKWAPSHAAALVLERLYGVPRWAWFTDDERALLERVGAWG